MSKFVNYKKRSVTLPPGCKDLMDVLQPQQRPEPHSIPVVGTKTEIGKEAVVTRDESGTIKLPEVEKCVASFLESRAAAGFLILNPGGELRLDVGRNWEDAPPRGWAYLLGKTQREQSMRAFLTEHGFKLPHKDPTSKAPEPRFPDWPVYDLYPFPSDPTNASRLIVELFRRVGEISDDEALVFQIVELEAR